VSSRPTFFACAVLAIVMSTANCTSGAPPAEDAPSAESPQGVSSSAGSSAPPTGGGQLSAPTVDDTFDVGGHELYMRCTGTGSPTIVYLHGYIFDPSGGGSQNAGDVPALLDDRFHVCIYDRANVGLSDTVEGPLTGRTSIRDLEALLEAAGVEGPYVLVGGSFGGLLAYMYAVTHPRDVVGMVLLDPNLPGYHEESFDWRSTTEQIDQSAASREASSFEGREPDIPVTLVGIENPEVDFVSGPEEYEEIKEQILRAQRRFLDAFPQGELVIVDTPHYMEPAIPDRIAQEVTEVAARS
jgi:pimeloyl-ACP methyl ester carboxylesterase